jgi:uncharacterized peroxidase-related enzyme
MPRLHEVTVEQTTGDARTFLEELQRRRGSLANIFKGLANGPAALAAYKALATAMKQSALTAKEREFIAIFTAELNGCGYCLAAHGAAARTMGVHDDQLTAWRRGEPEDAKLRALADFVRAVVEKRGRVSDDELAAFRAAGYTDAHIADVTAAIGQAIFTNYFNSIFEPAIDFPALPKLADATA